MKKGKWISVRVTDKMYETLERIAEEKGVTLPDLVRHILLEYIESHKTQA